MNDQTTLLRKTFSPEQIVPLLPQIDKVEFWHQLVPELSISAEPFQGLPRFSLTEEQKAEYALQLKEEGYFQTEAIVPEETLQQMRDCIEKVKQVGLHPTFALVYDIFYQVFFAFDAVLAGVFNSRYRLIPNFWVYYIEPTDDGKGFEPHRDAEYEDTIDENGGASHFCFGVKILKQKQTWNC